MTHHILILLSFFFLLSSNVLAQSNDDCLACHSDAELTMERKGKVVKLFVQHETLTQSTHRKLNCVSCHTAFDANELPHKETITPVNCLTCHANAKVKHQFHPQIARSAGINGTKDVSCKGCHGTHDVQSPKRAGAKFSLARLVTDCAECHQEVTKNFSESAHGMAMQAGVKGAPNCLKCHTTKLGRLMHNGDKAELKRMEDRICLSCHLDDKEIRNRVAPSAGFIAAYEKSVHGAALMQGKGDAAGCVDCHGSHEMKKSFDPTAKVNPLHITETCGKCHTNIAKDFAESVHGKGLVAGKKGVPGCTDCHGEHNILSPKDPRSPVAPLNVSGQVCSPCHSSLRLSQRYGIQSDRFKTFQDSYHGLALSGGSVEVANCASCHGVHNIKSSSDPTSTIHKSNLSTTCGSCHPGANERFVKGKVHITITREEEPILYWISTIYLILIITTIGFMFVHNVADFVKKSKRHMAIRHGELIEEHYPHRLYVRMTLNERIQHALMAISFILLAVTGFMLRYPDAWWVVAIRNLSEDAFAVRSLLHRISGVVMIAISLYHLGYIIGTKKGRSFVKDIFPRYQDLRDMIAQVKYNFGTSPVKPQFGRFSYIEKSEYWALVWGTIVMSATGIVMWFDNTFMNMLTKLGWDISRTVHFWEAWLAVLAIIVWHFYYVIFNPDAYPVNTAFLKGTITEKEMAEEHPLELEAIHSAKEATKDKSE